MSIEFFVRLGLSRKTINQLTQQLNTLIKKITLLEQG